MAAKSGRSNSPLIDQLLDEPYRFSFFQAIRLLEKLKPDSVPVGHTGPAREEALRLQAHLALSFPPSEIVSLLAMASSESGSATLETEQLPPMELKVAFLGLYGPSGVLPYCYTELLMQRRRAGDRTATAFLDLFHHRLLSLFLRAWEKYRPAIRYERGGSDQFARHLLALMGLGIEPLRGRHEFPDTSLPYHVGAISQRHRSPIMLQRLVAERFGFPVEVQSFHGRWLHIETQDCSRLTARASYNQLGVNLVVGNRIWDEQGRFRLRIGPLDWKNFSSLDPKNSRFKRLCQLVRLYVDGEFDFDIQIVLLAEEVPRCCLSSSAGEARRLGRDAWLNSRSRLQDADDAAFPGDC